MNKKFTASIFAFVTGLLLSCGHTSSEGSTFISFSSESESTTSSSSRSYEEMGLSADFQGKLNCNGSSIDVAFTLDYPSIIQGDNTVYSYEFAKLGILLATDAYSNCALVLDDVPFPSTGVKDRTSLYQNFACKDVEVIRVYGEDEYEHDLNDNAVFVMAHREMEIAGEQNEFIFLTIQGTNSHQEWVSNFDIGSETSYLSLSNDHPEWTNHFYHKGFGVTANRIHDKAEAYLSAHIDEAAKKTIFISGHSRGGALANIIGAEFENNADYKSYTYAYASPNFTAEVENDYQTIFNIRNKQDYVTHVPSEKQGFHRYGHEIISDIADYQEEYERFTKNKFVSCPVDKLNELMYDVASDREDAYTLKEENELFPNETKFFQTANDAAAAMRNMDKKISSVSSSIYAKLTCAKEDGGYRIKAYDCAGFAFQAFGTLIGKMKSLELLTLIKNLRGMLPESQAALLSGIYENVSGVGCGHMQESYLCIVEHIH